MKKEINMPNWFVILASTIGFILICIFLSFRVAKASNPIPYISIGDVSWRDGQVVRFSDKEKGVTCYTYSGAYGRGGLSCVITGANTK